ncbi:Hypothetical protein GbCGDNIH2_7051 [Granulibacter bethesdensis]|nr:Hypothetical protein GbCGDNIH2_7051 [Granulibacter bethesdensis]
MLISPGKRLIEPGVKNGKSMFHDGRSDSQTIKKADYSAGSPAMRSL